RRAGSLRRDHQHPAVLDHRARRPLNRLGLRVLVADDNARAATSGAPPSPPHVAAVAGHVDAAGSLTRAAAFPPSFGKLRRFLLGLVVVRRPGFTKARSHTGVIDCGVGWLRVCLASCERFATSSSTSHGCCWSASTPACDRARSGTTSPGAATRSGGCFTRPA